MHRHATLRSALLLCAALAALAACNTIQGMGRDIEGAGEAIGGTAKKTKDNM